MINYTAVEELLSFQQSRENKLVMYTGNKTETSAVIAKQVIASTLVLGSEEFKMCLLRRKYLLLCFQGTS